MLTIISWISSRADIILEKGLVPEKDAIRSLWELFEDEKLSLVTSVDEMELDFVIHMNRGGLCVTDTFQITDNIDTFERWTESDRCRYQPTGVPSWTFMISLRS